MYRVEDKFCCSAQEMYQLQRRLEGVLRADSNEKNAEGYSVVSLYFDDFKDTCLTDTREGHNDRRKFRIRIYDHSLKTIKLEIKEKKNNRIFKRSKQITEEEMHRLLHGQCIADPSVREPSAKEFSANRSAIREPSVNEFSVTEDPALSFNLAVKTQGLRPKVIVAYERKAYLYEPGNVRITLDRNVRASRQLEAFGSREIFYDYLEGQDAVLEIKYDEFLPQFLLQLLETGSMRQTAYSKYQLCRERYERDTLR